MLKCIFSKTSYKRLESPSCVGIITSSLKKSFSFSEECHLKLKDYRYFIILTSTFTINNIKENPRLYFRMTGIPGALVDGGGGGRGVLVCHVAFHYAFYLYVLKPNSALTIVNIMVICSKWMGVTQQ